MRKKMIEVTCAIRILKLLAQQRGLSTSKIADELKTKPAYTSSVLMGLYRQHFVKRDAHKQRRFYSIATAGVDYLKQFQIQIQIQN